MCGEISPSLTRMRLRFPVSLAIRVHFSGKSLQSSAKRIEFSAASNSAWFSSDGRSLATAISIPNTVETTASEHRPSNTNASRSFFSLGFVRRGGGGGGGVACRRTKRGPRAEGEWVMGVGGSGMLLSAPG
jgi:hypothetical protein